jgi:cysteine-S-conjugate beta-lyase
MRSPDVVISEFDSLSVERLRTVVGAKWSTYPDCIGAFVAEMDYGTAPVVQDTLRAVVDEGFFGYVRKQDVEAMQQAVADWYRDHASWEIPTERIRPLPDVIKGLEVAIGEFSTPGSPVIVPTPAYMPFITMPGHMGRALIQVPMRVEDDRWVFDDDALDAAFSGQPEGTLLIVCNPLNPLGRVFEREELQRVAEIVDAHKGRVFSDEVHAPIIYPGKRHVPYASVSNVAAGHTLTSTSASKAWNLAGLKCAQMIVSNDADAARWKQVGYLPEHSTSPLGIIANATAFRDGQPWLDEVLQYLDGNRRILGDLLQEHLPRARYIQPEGTYLAWIDLEAYDLPQDAAGFFREEAKVAVTNGFSCGDAGKGSIRFNFAMSRETLSRAIQQMGAAIQSARATT